LYLIEGSANELSVATGQEMVRGKNKLFKVREKSGNFILSQEKLIF